MAQVETQLGTVKSWFDAKGFGFIKQEGAMADIFVHYTAIRMGGRRALSPGQLVRFRTERRDRGLMAVDVEPADDLVDGRCPSCGQEVPR